MGDRYDIFIIGGGINGCGIARDAAGRGYNVCLVEMNDLASGTSSRSTKLIHGGLRYLEHYEFRLVREALVEREVLLNMAPHIIWPMRFVLPHHKAMRPAWLLRLGLFLYDNLGGRKLLPPTKVLDLGSDEAGNCLKSKFTKAFEYSDCWVNDTRLVVLNAMDAAKKGAAIHPRTKVISVKRRNNHWNIQTKNTLTGKTQKFSARLIVNAAGPWVDEVLANSFGKDGARNIRLVQGSHIVINKKFEHERAYFFQNSDERIFFAIPYEQEYTLIGTTDRDFNGDSQNVAISQKEIEYLCEGASGYFREPITPSDVIWTYSGVRPLYDDGASKAQEATRKYILRAVSHDGEPMVINIFGGKITTYRKLALSMLTLIEEAIGPKGKSWTRGTKLPGGDFPADGFDKLLSQILDEYPFLTKPQAHRMVRAYGTSIRNILKEANSLTDLGKDFGFGLTQIEVKYLIDHEWAKKSEDILWRRTKLGIRFSEKQTAVLGKWMNKNI